MVKKPVLTMTIGIPASGKTTIRNMELKKDPNLCVASFDDIRFKMLDFENTGRDFDPSIEPEVRERFFKKLDSCFDERRNIFIDATSVSKEKRAPIIEKAKKLGYKTRAIYLPIDPDLAFYRQFNRGRIVPKTVIYQMYLTLDPPKRDEFSMIETIHQYANRKECRSLDGKWLDDIGRCVRVRPI